MMNFKMMICKKQGECFALFFLWKYVKIIDAIKLAEEKSKTGNRSCNCRKAADEESPGFTGQDAG